MKTEPIKTNPSQPQVPATPAAAHPQPDPIACSIHSIQNLVAQLNQRISAGSDTANPDSQLDQQIILQTAAAITHFKVILEEDCNNKCINNNLVRSIALLEKIRCRLERRHQAAARNELRKLSLQNQVQRAMPERDDAIHFLQTELARGERPAKELIQSARDLGISTKTLNRAKTDLQIHSRLDCTGTRAWHWSLPIAKSPIQNVESHDAVASAPGQITLPKADEPSISLEKQKVATTNDHL